MKSLFYILFLISLSACNTTPTVIMKPAVINIAPELVKRCPYLPTISNGKTTVNMGDLVTYNTTISQIYIECATKDDALIDVVSPKK
jgi:hypothetical protein